jgi:hypothetical protein
MARCYPAEIAPATPSLGLGTTVAYCPTPCATMWPLLEVANWANTLSGLLAALACGLALRAPRAG